LTPIDVNVVAILGEPFDLITARASDSDGDMLTFIWNLGDGTTITGVSDEELGPEYWHARAGLVQAFTLNHTFREPCADIVYSVLLDDESFLVEDPRSVKGGVVLLMYCRFNLNLTVTDEVGHQEFWDSSILATSENLPPTFDQARVQVFQRGQPLKDKRVFVGEPIQLTLPVSDPDGDPMTITIDFGDGNAQVFTGVVNGTLSVNHNYTEAWSYLGGQKRLAEYSVNITLTDGRVGLFNHEVRAVLTTIFMSLIPILVEEPPWDFVDYTTLAAVVMAPIALFLWGRRARLREEEEEV
jgi:hypothetical protein